MDTISELYEAISTLLETKSDPENEPYKSKYAGRELLHSLKSILSDQIDAQDDVELNNPCSTTKAQLAVVLLQLGIIGIDTEELSTGQEHLESVIDLISKYGSSPECVCTLVVSYNQLAVLWSQRDEQKKAETYLNAARELYNTYRHKDLSEPPKAAHELFNCHLNSVFGGWEALEKFHTLTLYYLAQVVGQLGRSSESAHLCLSTLHRQLTLGDYQIASWAINAATLAKFYHNNGKYRVARRLLAAAYTMLVNKPEEKPDMSPEKLDELKAEVCRRFGFYCVALFNDSKYYSFPTEADPPEQDETDPSEDDATASSKADNPTEEDCLEKMEFINLELTCTENSVECQKIKDYEGAKNLFMSGLRWYSDAQKFYSLEDHATVYTEIVQEVSTLYKLLACYEEAYDKQSKMHKRRVDMLTAVLNQLNPQYYLQVCRQLDYELGETYSSMIDCKYASLGENSPTTHRAAKINSLVSKSILHFQQYLDTFKGPENTLPEKYPSESVRPILIAYFHQGRLWSKKISVDIRERLQDMKNSNDKYQFIVDYCAEYPECEASVAQELPLCREMVQLLPLKMEQIRSRC